MKILYQIKFVLIAMLVAFTVHAEVVLDGTMGTAGALKGPAYDIPADYGQRSGANLFHSFQTFSINTSESATFRGPSSIQNVISRVTGGSLSRIDGLLKCTIPNADVYLLNPAGVIFGAAASLDIGGSFHVSTADYLRLGEHERFYTTPIEGEVLSSAAPSAFGFLNDSPAPVKFEGQGFIGASSEKIQTGITVADGKTISVTGGDIEMSGTSYTYQMSGETFTLAAGSIAAPGGRIIMAATASEGEVVMTDAAPDVSSFEKLGTIKLSDYSMLSVSGTDTGNIFIRGNRFYADSSQIRADAAIGYPNSGGNISVQAPESVELSGSQIAAASGSIEIETRNFSLASIVNNGIKTDGIVSADTYAGTQGGSISIHGLNGNAAESVIVSDAQILGGAYSSGNGGKIFIEADRISFEKGGYIDSRSYADGRGGDVYLHAIDSLKFSGKGGITTSSEALNAPAGNAGNITIEADQLSFDEGTGLSASTKGPGDAGAISITVNQLTMNTNSKISSLTASAENGGDAGTIDIIATQEIDMNNSGISTSTLGGGAAGDISIKVGTMNMDNSAAIGSASFSSPDYPGDAGRITIQALDSLYLGEGTSITTEAINGGRGQIIINAGNTYRMENSKITTTIKRGGNDAGDITINPPEWIVMRDSQIVANAYQGRGGNIHLSSDHFVSSVQSKVDASSELGIDGTVIIDSPDTNSVSGFIALPQNFMDATRWIKTPCAQRSAEKVSQFVIKNQDAVAVVYNDWQPSPDLWLDSVEDRILRTSYFMPSSLFDMPEDFPCRKCKSEN